MRLASAPGIALAFLGWACASPSSADDPATAAEAPSTTRGGSLAPERQLVEGARESAKAADLAAAREKAGEAIALLLARPESERDADWVELVNAAGGEAWEAQDARAAATAWEIVLEIRSRTLPEDHPDLQTARQNLAIVLYTLGEFAAAHELFEKLLEVSSRTLPDDHPDLQIVRLNVASTFYALGDLESSRTLGEKVLEVASRSLPEDHPDLQMARQNLASTLLAIGDVAAAHTLFEKVLEVLSRTLPDDHPNLQMARGNLALTLEMLGDVAAARALEEEVVEVLSRTLPDDHPDLQKARLNLASTLYRLGDLVAARALQEKVLEVLSRTMPDDYPDLQEARLRLARTLDTLGDYAAARALFEKVLEVVSRTQPDDHPQVRAARQGLAITFAKLGDVAEARTLFEESLDVLSRTLPDDHPDLQKARLNLASTLSTLGDLEAARALEEKVLEVFTRTLPEDHPDLQKARGNLLFTLAAGHAAENGGEEEFARLAGSFTRGISRSARAAVLTASGREAEERCANSLPDLGRALSFADGLGVFEKDPGLERETFVLSEGTRGAALASAHLSRRAGADPRYGELRERVRTASDDLAQLAQQGAGEDEIDRARSARETAERELARLASELSGGDAGILEHDPASLSEREALVGYRRYTRWLHERGGASELEVTESLCAFVLRSGDRLERIELGPIEPIEQAVERWREAIGARLERGVSVGPNAADESLLRGEELRKLVFDPLRRVLDETDRVVVALDDVLQLVPLDALPLENTKLLGDRWRIETRCTLSELAWKENALPHRETLLAFGGASFNQAPLPPSAEETAALEVEPTGSTEVPSVLRGGAWERGFGPLAHSGPEARGIAELYGEAFGDERPALVLEKRKASRAALVELAPRARFLHVATHGWFAPESVRSMADPESLDERTGFGSRMSGEERARGMSPMLLCGLALAGANLSEDERGRAPGLITAEEMSTLDLTGCELAVLSACDTNVGERRAGQGVASLQKALHMAGARTVITSLWKVPDEATRELMLDFYRRIWIEKKPKGVALWEAKRKIRDAKDERGKPLYSTRDWAAWVLTGDPN